MKAATAWTILFLICAMLLGLVVIWIMPGWTFAGRVGATGGWFVGAAVLSGFGIIA